MIHPDIREFQGEYRWGSNFWPSVVEMDGVMYPTVEHAYQASKTLYSPERVRVLNCKTPGDAKRMGRELTLRPDWEDIKRIVMYELVREKFTRHPDLARKLIDTGNCEIFEGNYFHDNFWGQCYCDRCKHKLHFNYLGIILMQVRNELHEQQATEQGE